MAINIFLCSNVDFPIESKKREQRNKDRTCRSESDEGWNVGPRSCLHCCGANGGLEGVVGKSFYSCTKFVIFCMGLCSFAFIMTNSQPKQNVRFQSVFVFVFFLQ